jgi:hypothetical protein
MATISITIPDALLDRAVAGVCWAHFYQETIDGEPNPETKAAFCKRMIRQHIKNCVLQYEGDQAAQTARTSAGTEVDI